MSENLRPCPGCGVLLPETGGQSHRYIGASPECWAAFGKVSEKEYGDFEVVLENFMNMIGYWLAIYEGIAFAEHFVFKHGMKGYNPDFYDQPGRLPPGIAAVFSFCCGVAGMVTGMSQVWWVGPIALHAGEAPFGGDVGFELGFAFAFAAYCVTRPLELRMFGR